MARQDPEPDCNNKSQDKLINRSTSEEKITLDQVTLEKCRKLFKPSDQTEKNIAFALSEITRIVCELSLPRTVLEATIKLYKVILEERLVKGRTIRAFCAAATYATCRQRGFVRTLEEIARVSKTNRKEIGHCYRILLKELDFSIPPPSLSDYVSRLLNQLEVKGEVAEMVGRILKFAEESKITLGKEPMGLVSAAVYIASRLSRERITQRQVSDAAGVTEATIRNRCRELERFLQV
jgi:transcription initiation factor TFIIB